ncbi:MAG: hypothetical protein ABFS28_14185 [Bacteroidota bacterium]
MRKYFFLIIMVLSSLSLFAQGEMPSRKGKFFLIPELWLSFGTRTYIELGPLLGYHVNDRLSAGLGPHYIYQSQRATPSYPYSYETHTYGIKSFGRFSLITNADQFLPIKLFNDLFVHVEYEALSLESAYYSPPGSSDEGRFLYHALLMGGGFSQRIGMYNSVSFMVLWDVNGTSSSPYSNPIFRVGFNTFF